MTYIKVPSPIFLKSRSEYQYQEVNFRTFIKNLCLWKYKKYSGKNKIVEFLLVASLPYCINF